jgi:FkbM family methyltransferase
MKRMLRRVARGLFARVRVRGRHRFADVVGRYLAPSGIEIVDLNEVKFPVDHSIAVYRYVYYGLYEEDNVRLAGSLLRPGDVCIDAGANIGYLTSVFAGHVGEEGRVFAFEPSRRCVRSLSFLTDVQNVELFAEAVGAQEGVAGFYDTERAVTKGYSFLAELRPDPGDADHYEVSVRALDDFCRQRRIGKVRLLKLDVEGAELAALRGANGLLAEARIDYVLVESSYSESEAERTRDDEIAGLLDDHGYRAIARHGRDTFWQSPAASD